MADPKIRIRRSATPNKVPLTSQLQLGELAINTFDGKLYLEQDQTGASGIATVIVVNPWSVGLGSLAYDTFFTAGNVGVGTTVPTSALDVVGDVNVSGVVTATNFVGSLTGTATTATNVVVSQSGTQTDHFVMLAIDGSIDSAVRLDSGLKFHTGTNSLTITGDIIVGGGLSVTGISTFNGDVDINANVDVSGIVTATSFVGDGSGIFNLPGATVGVDTNTTNQAQIIPFALGYGSTTGFGATDGFVFNPSTTRLGIGSATPAYALDVVGDINSSTDVKINGTGVLDTALALAIALG